MLKRLYANNYRSLVNFELYLDEVTLLIGPNGGGKSTVLDLLFALRRFLAEGAKVHDAFPPEDRTAWSTRSEQAFELEVQGEGGVFLYRLALSLDAGDDRPRVAVERLLFEGRPLFEFVQGEIRLYDDDHRAGAVYSFDTALSGLGMIVPRPDNTKLTRFKQWIEHVGVLSLQPSSMVSETAEEARFLDRRGSNFASWYRYLSQEHQDKAFELTETLRDVLPGFHAFKLEQAGRRRVLKVGFTGDGFAAPVFFDFEQLSDGQRILIVLYTLLLGIKSLGMTLFLDEPENYVALAEIQPWLMELCDACGDASGQALLVSHHPELIDYLGSEHGKWIEREPLGPARVLPPPRSLGESLTLSEQIARGWTD